MNGTTPASADLCADCKHPYSDHYASGCAYEFWVVARPACTCTGFVPMPTEPHDNPKS
jgi:hypothetical protein